MGLDWTGPYIPMLIVRTISLGSAPSHDVPTCAGYHDGKVVLQRDFLLNLTFQEL